MNKKNRDQLLGVAALLTLLAGVANALEYYLAGMNYLAKREGVVETIQHNRFTDDDGNLNEKTTIYLEGSRKKYYLAEIANDGGYIEVEKGDTVVLYTRRWNQFFYNFDYKQNIYYVERNGMPVYNNLPAWKGAAFSFMCLFGGCALLLTLMYLDQVKNISLTNLIFRKRKGVEKGK